MERVKLNATTYLAVGAAAVCGTVCGFLAGQRLATKKADERHAAETAALRQHYGTRLADANAAAKGDHPGDGASAVGGPGDKPDLEWLKTKLAPVVKEELGEAELRAGTGRGVPYSTASGSGKSGTPPRGPVVARRNALDDAAAEGRLHDPVGEEAPGAAGDTSGTTRHDGSGGSDPLEGINDGAKSGGQDDQDDGAVGVGPLLAPDGQPGQRIQLISEEEFLAHDLEDYTQVELKFFEGDGVLCDERDVPVRSPDMIAGKFATHFGHGTSNPDMVHIRNNVMKLDIEITRRETEYRTEVLGYGVPE